MNLKDGVEKIYFEKMEDKDLTHVLSMDSFSFHHSWSKAMFIEEMQNPFAHCFVTQLNGTSKHHVVGFICFRNLEDESELFNICVHPQYRRLGIGKKMMQFYFNFCLKMRIKTFYLEVNSSNEAAIHLYHLCSYQPMGTRKKFYQNKFDALLMVKKA